MIKMVHVKGWKALLGIFLIIFIFLGLLKFAFRLITHFFPIILFLIIFFWLFKKLKKTGDSNKDSHSFKSDKIIDAKFKVKK